MDYVEYGVFVLSNVHILKDEGRGATLEVVVSRMKTVQAVLTQISEDTEAKILVRFVAVSATIPNITDIAEWLSDARGPATCLEMDESHRPVKLRKVVLGFPSSNNQTEFKFDLTLNYKVASVIQTYSEQKPVLVFCATRKGVQQAAFILAKDAKFIMSIEHKQRLLKYVNSVRDCKLRDILLYGVGYHHAGMEFSDRKAIEAAFTVGDLPVLFTTSTLAMGVNLPAHLVVIKSTMHYAGGMFQEYSETDILQMIGRAGRPQFDSTATAVIMTRSQTKEKYLHMLNGADTIESSLHKHLVEHLNAEIALHTITNVSVALEWIRSTFLYIRTLKNPNYYGFPPGLDRAGTEAKLQELCLKNLNALSSISLIKMDEDVNFKPTETGKLMTRFYIAYGTMKQFSLVTGLETLSELVAMVSGCQEFADVQLRVNEKKLLNSLNKDKNRTTIRFPLDGKIKTAEMKVNCLIQTHLGCIPIQEFGLVQDTAKIFRNGTRVTKCLAEFLLQEDKKNFSALLNCQILAKCFRAKLWENSPYVSKQLDKIGISLSNAMVNAGLTTFQKIEDTNARELELIVNRHPPFGNQIRDAVAHLPKYELSVEQTGRYSATVAEILVTIVLTNFSHLQAKRTAPDSHYIMCIIGDADNNVVFKQKIIDSQLLKTGTWCKKIDVQRAMSGEELSVNLISSDFVGLDIQQKYVVFYSGPKRFGNCLVTQVEPRDENVKTLHQTNKVRSETSKGKTGVKAAPCSRTTENSHISSYICDLRTRRASSSAPAVKRLKLKMENESQSIALPEFASTANASSPVPSCENMTECPSPPAHCPSTPAQDWDHLDAFVRSRQQVQLDYYEKDFSLWKPSAGQSQSDLPLSAQHKLFEVLNKSSSDPSDNGYWSSELLNVTFDLGDVGWDDYDDDNLINASSISAVEPNPAASSCLSQNQ